MKNFLTGILLGWLTTKYGCMNGCMNGCGCLISLFILMLCFILL